MTEADRDKWNERYATGSYRGQPRPSTFLESWLPALPRGRALDLACGRGRNSLRLAQAGFSVDALDISAVALADGAERAAAAGLDVNWLEADLDEAAIDPDTYDLVLVVRYLARGRIPSLKAALHAGGFLLYEQHVVSAEAVGGPRTGRFRLERNELLRSFLDFQIVHYAEGLDLDPDGGLMALARLVAVKPPGAGAPSALPRLPRPRQLE